MQVNPLLNFDGRCEEAFRAYEKSLNGKIESIIPFEGTPAAEHAPAEWRKKVLIAKINVGGQILLGSDVPPGQYQKPQGFMVAIEVNDPAEAERIFRELSENGRVDMPMQQTFWAVRFGMATDRFGIPWAVNCEQHGE